MEQSEQEQIDAGARVRAFVQDVAVQAAITRMATKNYELFKQAKSPEELFQASARGSLLDAFIAELQVTIDRGAVSRINRDGREQREKKAGGIVS